MASSQGLEPFLDYLITRLTALEADSFSTTVMLYDGPLNAKTEHILCSLENIECKVATDKALVQNSKVSESAAQLRR